MKLIHAILLASAAMLHVATASAQNAESAEEQRKIIHSLEKSISEEEKVLSGIKSSKNTAQKRITSLGNQIRKRRTLITATEKRISQLDKDIIASTAHIGELTAQLEELENSAREMIREAYRNYRFQSADAFLFSSPSAVETARRLASLRSASASRKRQIEKTRSIRSDVNEEIERFQKTKEEQTKYRKNLAAQQVRLNADMKEAKATLGKMSAEEKKHMQVKLEQQNQLEQAIAKLRKLTRGNKTGNSFSAKTSSLRIPVTGGSVKRYMKNMAEIVGPEGASVTSIFEGKVVDVKRNKINGKYDIYVAHGEYISSYANLSSASVRKNDVVQANQHLGVIGPSVNLNTMETEYKIIFGIYAPSPKITMSAQKLFSK